MKQGLWRTLLSTAIIKIKLNVVVFAINTNGERIKPTQHAKATCPHCGSLVIAKCGEINVHHWAHENLQDCDSWSHEPITQWHIDWQECFPLECREVQIKRGHEWHRADIESKNNTIIEVQNSHISPEEIFQREQFYGNMLWIINSERFKHNLTFTNFPLDFDRDFSHYKTVDEKKPGYYILKLPLINDLEIKKALKENGFYPCDEDDYDEEYWENKHYIAEIPDDIIRAYRNYLFDENLQMQLERGRTYETNFRWKFHSKCWEGGKKIRILDLNNRFLFFIKTLHEKGYGFGVIISKWNFLRKYQ